MTSFTTNYELDTITIDTNPCSQPLIFLPITPETTPPPTPTGYAGYAMDETSDEEVEDNDEDEEQDLPYHIRWEDELSRRRRRTSPPVTETTAASGNYYKDLIFPVFNGEEILHNIV
jgi:hypothetical protein